MTENACGSINQGITLKLHIKLASNIVTKACSFAIQQHLVNFSLRGLVNFMTGISQTIWQRLHSLNQENFLKVK